MWPFKKKPKQRRMIKVTLIDGVEFLAETGTTVRAMIDWILVNVENEEVLYPREQVRTVRYWNEDK